MSTLLRRHCNLTHRDPALALSSTRGNIDAREEGIVPGKHRLRLQSARHKLTRAGLEATESRSGQTGAAVAELVGETQQNGEKKLSFHSVPRKYSGAKSPVSDPIGSAAHPGVMSRGARGTLGEIPLRERKQGGCQNACAGNKQNEIQRQRTLTTAKQELRRPLDCSAFHNFTACR